jgi:hypothetical protein
MEKIIITLIMIGGLTIGYVINVGVVTLIQWLVNITFATNYDYNIWALGGLLSIITLFIGGLFRG